MTNDKKTSGAREWHIPKIDFIHYYDAAGKYKIPGKDKVHVVEYGALAAALSTIEENKHWEAKFKNANMDKSEAIFRERIAQSTLEAAQKRILELEEALKEIAKVTYGTELCNSDEENNAILAPWVFRYQEIARKALSQKPGETK